MSDNRKVAADLLSEAGRTILKDRPGVHGSAEQSFTMIADMWTVYLRHARKVRGVDTIKPEDVAHMMVLLKHARAMYGDRLNRDNFIDAIGYEALAGMLQLPDYDKSVGETLNELDVTVEDNAEKTDAA